MAHKANSKAFCHIDSKTKKNLGPKYTYHVVSSGFAVAGFNNKEHANDDAKARTDKAKEMGIETVYTVEPMSEAEMS